MGRELYLALVIIPVSEKKEKKNHPKSMFMNFPQNWHADVQTNIVKPC